MSFDEYKRLLRGLASKVQTKIMQYAIALQLFVGEYRQKIDYIADPVLLAARMSILYDVPIVDDDIKHAITLKSSCENYAKRLLIAQLVGWLFVKKTADELTNILDSLNNTEDSETEEEYISAPEDVTEEEFYVVPRSDAISVTPTKMETLRLLYKIILRHPKLQTSDSTRVVFHAIIKMPDDVVNSLIEKFRDKAVDYLFLKATENNEKFKKIIFPLNK